MSSPGNRAGWAVRVHFFFDSGPALFFSELPREGTLPKLGVGTCGAMHGACMASNADLMHPLPSPLSQVKWEATPGRMGIVCRSVAAVAAVVVETVAPDR